MTPPDEPDLGDEDCSVDGCPWVVLLDEELCPEHMEQAAEDEIAERKLDEIKEDFYE